MLHFLDNLFENSARFGLAVIYYGIKRSDDGGETWIEDTNLEHAVTAGNVFSYDGDYDGIRVIISDMVFDRNFPTTRFAIGNAGVFQTSDGINWIQLLSTEDVPGHPASGYFDPISEPSDAKLYVAFDGRGILQLSPISYPDLTVGALQSIKGKITLLRVNDVGTGFGPPTDSIDVEVVITLDSAPDQAFGFQLRNDNKGPCHQAMFDLLCDAYSNSWNITIAYDVTPPKKNGIIIRAIVQ